MISKAFLEYAEFKLCEDRQYFLYQGGLVFVVRFVLSHSYSSCILVLSSIEIYMNQIKTLFWHICAQLIV